MSGRSTRLRTRAARLRAGPGRGKLSQDSKDLARLPSQPPSSSSSSSVKSEQKRKLLLEKGEKAPTEEKKRKLSSEKSPGESSFLSFSESEETSDTKTLHASSKPKFVKTRLLSSGLLDVEVEGSTVRDIIPHVCEASKGFTESIASEENIRAQVLQSVHHSLSSSSEVNVRSTESPFLLFGEENTAGPSTSAALSEESVCVSESVSESGLLESVSESGLLESVSESGLLSDQGPQSSESVEATGHGEEDREVCGACGESGPHVCSSRVFSCPNCKKSFSSKFKLSRHQLIHGGERQYRCTICDRSFHRKDHLKNHHQIHAPNKQFQCPKPGCGKEYNSYMSYRKHCAFHSAEEGDLQCKFCLKMFDNKEELLYHLKEHVGTRSVKNPSEKKFQCDQCDRRFFTKKDVKRHLVVHTGTRDFCCSLCPQKFGRKDHLVRHLKKSHGVTDMSRVETLSDPLAVPGPSSSSAGPSFPPPSPGLSSLSTSSGEAPPSLTPFLLAASPQPPSSPVIQDPLPSYQDVGAASFSGFSSDLLLSPEPIKEEPDLTASVTGLGPDLSNILGLYLPSSEGINMNIMESTPTYSSGGSGNLPGTSPSFSGTSPSLGVTSLQASYSDQPFEPLSPVPFSPHTSSPPPPEGEEGGSSSTPPVTSSSQMLPGFDQAFP